MVRGYIAPYPMVPSVCTENENASKYDLGRAPATPPTTAPTAAPTGPARGFRDTFFGKRDFNDSEFEAHVVNFRSETPIATGLTFKTLAYIRFIFHEPFIFLATLAAALDSNEGHHE